MFPSRGFGGPDGADPTRFGDGLLRQKGELDLLRNH